MKDNSRCRAVDFHKRQGYLYIHTSGLACVHNWIFGAQSFGCFTVECKKKSKWVAIQSPDEIEK